MLQRSASERRKARRKVNQRFLTAMMDMGIPNEKAELALSETGNVGVEVATEWLFSVPDHVLEKHLASEPNTPVEAAAQNPEDHRVMLPRRVPLQVSNAFHPSQNNVVTCLLCLCCVCNRLHRVWQLRADHSSRNQVACYASANVLLSFCAPGERQSRGLAGACACYAVLLKSSQSQKSLTERLR